MPLTLVTSHIPLPEPGASETISPELALIDPELRRRARETLSDDPGGERRARAADALLARRPGRGAAAAAKTDETAATRPGRNARRRRLLPVAILAAAVLVLATARPTTLDADRRDTRSPAPPRSSSRSPNVGLKRVATRGTVRTKRIRQRVAQSVKQRTLGTLARTRGRWTFVWPSHPRADYYNVRFARDRRTIFEAWPRRPRLVVPAQGVSRGRAFRFSRGRYRWVVRPGFGPRARRRYGQPIVLSTWTVARTAAE